MHGKNAEKAGKMGKEYWKSRLHPQGEIPGRFTKDLTHKKERKQNKRVARDIVKGLDD
jgi:hypothetical protein